MIPEHSGGTPAVQRVAELSGSHLLLQNRLNIRAFREQNQAAGLGIESVYRVCGTAQVFLNPLLQGVASTGRGRRGMSLQKRRFEDNEQGIVFKADFYAA